MLRKPEKFFQEKSGNTLENTLGKPLSTPFTASGLNPGGLYLKFTILRATYEPILANS
jgi:hypothetical protein